MDIGAVCLRRLAAATLLALGAVVAPLAGAATTDDLPDRSATAPASQPTQILVMIRMAPAHFRPDADYGDGYGGRAAQAPRRRAAADIARRHGLQILSHWPMPAIGVECYEMQVPDGMAAAAVAEAVSRDPRAAWAQPVQTFGGLGYNDPLYELQPTASAWRLHALHASTTGRGVLVAQIDSGVEVEHPDLRGQLGLAHNAVAHSDYAAEHHGTAIAGIIAARANNGLGTVGVAPGVRLLALRGCWERVAAAALCDSLSLAKALQLALERGAQVLNLSVGGPPDRLLHELLNVAIRRGVIVVAAADAAVADGGFPAAHPGVISVAGTAAGTTARAAFVAPGLDLPTTLPGARWGLVSGASFAAAEISGMVALLLELMPGASAPQIDALLRQAPQRNIGHSIVAPAAIDACRSVSVAAGRCVCDCSALASTSTLAPH